MAILKGQECLISIVSPPTSILKLTKYALVLSEG